MERILKIEDTTKHEDSWQYKAGYKVITTEQEIELLIDNEQSCCENWGYFWCNDNPQDFIDAELRGISITDTELNTHFMQNEAYNRDEGGIMFVNLDTDKGVLQFVAYNSHNGYYGHEATVTSTQLEHRETL